jgi:hypothetical protein
VPLHKDHHLGVRTFSSVFCNLFRSDHPPMYRGWVYCLSWAVRELLFFFSRLNSGSELPSFNNSDPSWLYYFQLFWVVEDLVILTHISLCLETEPILLPYLDITPLFCAPFVGFIPFVGFSFLSPGIYLFHDGILEFFFATFWINGVDTHFFKITWGLSLTE